MTEMAVLLLVYRRPEATALCLDAIRQARPARLYIAADGPRSEEVREACMAARSVTEQIDWPCNVTRLYRDTNLGPRLGVEQAIDWFFRHEEEGIILEDDCVPGADFFPYCEALLDRYREEERVMLVAGDRSFGYHDQTQFSYSFSRFPLVWGWATWRRAWKAYSYERFEPSDWSAVLTKAGLPDAFIAQRLKAYEALRNGSLEAWDYVWSFFVFSSGGLTCVPKVNLVTNVGFGPDAEHWKSASSQRANVAAQNLAWPLIHPPRIAPDRRTDSLISLYIHGAKPW